MVKQWYYQNMQCMVLKKILLKIFIKNKEAKWVLSNLGLRTPLSKVTSLGDILF